MAKNSHVKSSKRRPVLTAPAALKLLRSASQDGVIETASYTTLADLLGWDRTRTWKAVQRWARSGKVIVESSPNDDKLVLRIVPDRNALARTKGTGVAAPRRGAGKRTKASPAAAMEAPKAVPVGAAKPAAAAAVDTASIVSLMNAKTKTYADQKFRPGELLETIGEARSTSSVAAAPALSNASVRSTSEALPQAPAGTSDTPKKTSDETAMTSPSPVNPASISASTGTQNMSLFPRTGKPAGDPGEQAGEPTTPLQTPAPQFGYRTPAAISYPQTPSLHTEKPDWKIQQHSGGGEDRGPGFDAIDSFQRANAWERLLILIAFALSATAAYVSVNGMLTLYPAAGGVILVMGGLMEAMKFVGFGVVAAGWRSYGATSRSIFSILLLIAALVNAGGVYGWLISQHAAPAAARSATFTASDGDAAARVEVVQAKLTDLDKRLSLIDGAAEGAAKRGRANTALNVIQDQKKPRAAIEAERERTVKELADLRAGRAGLAARHQVDEAATLPVKYAAALFEDVGLLQPGTDPEKLFRWISFFILLCGDPAALAAMFMVNSRARRNGAAA